MGGEKGSQCRILVRARLLYKIFYDLSVHFTISHVYGRYFKISCSVLEVTKTWHNDDEDKMRTIFNTYCLN